MRLKTQALTLAAVLALASTAGAQDAVSFYGGKKYTYRIDQQDLIATPAWNPEKQASPPLAAGAAISAARELLTQVVPHATDWYAATVWLRRADQGIVGLLCESGQDCPGQSARLRPATIDDRWYYMIEFRGRTLEPSTSRSAASSHSLEQPMFSVMVLLDGKAVRPFATACAGDCL
jgi:hypothetical protein